jgi:hypothetical protein
VKTVAAAVAAGDTAGDVGVPKEIADVAVGSVGDGEPRW